MVSAGGIKGSAVIHSITVYVGRSVKHRKIFETKMELLDSLTWLTFSQQVYRLAVFRRDRSRSKLITDNLEIFFSVFMTSVITAEVCYIGHKVYFSPAENFFQINVGKLNKI